MADPKESETFVNQSMLLDDFLGTLVKSVAKGQTSLEKYYREDDEGRKSTVAYTIPSVSLEVKLNFTMTKEQGIAFLFKKTKETTTEIFSSLKLNLSAIPNPAIPKKKEIYRVKTGDTLAKIASKFGVSVQDIRKWNADKIEDPNKIKKGLELEIYS